MLIPRHQQQIEIAAAALIGVADDAGISLVDAIVHMERHMLTTKAGGRDQPPVEGRLYYDMIEGRLTVINP
jgi:hypothetical protein